MIQKIIKALEEKNIDFVRHLLVHTVASQESAKVIVSTIKKSSDFLVGTIPLKVAVLSSYTARNCSDILEYDLLRNGFNPEIKFGEYNSYVQELLNESSFVYSFKPDVIILCLDPYTFFDTIHHSFIDKTKEDIDSFFQSKKDYLRSILENSAKKLTTKIIVTNLEIPTYSPHGIRDVNMLDGLRYKISQFNYSLLEETKKIPNVIILDFEKIASDVGKKNVTDKKYFYLGKFYLSNSFIPHFSSEILKIINSSYGKSKKCLVVDLDNTLWGGVIGEDGVNGIKLGGDGIGAIYQEVQKIILNYYKKGVILAINSKNNSEDVLPVFEKNPNMILKKEHFACIKTNWKEKADNLIDIAKELNLGLDSFVFLDDNPVERGGVMAKLPMVYVPNFPEDISLLPSLLYNLYSFEFLDITEEDKKRNEMYAEEQKRTELEKTFTSVTDYLFDLQLKIEIKKNNAEDLERITQLINKTNQFNLCTNRYSKEEISAFRTNPKDHIFSVKVKDRFGDMGLTVICIAKEEEQLLEITDFLMSCRVMNRGVEKEVIRQVIDSLPKKEKVIGKYIPTKKNDPAKDFYESISFSKISEESDGKKTYVFDYSKPIEKVEWIESVE